MAPLVIWPDGTRFASDQLNNWVKIASATPDLTSVVNVYQSGLYTSSSFTYTADNDIVATLIISLLDNWYYGAQDSVLVISTALTNLGIVIGYLNPSTDTAGTPATISVYGQGIVDGVSFTVG